MNNSQVKNMSYSLVDQVLLSMRTRFAREKVAMGRGGVEVGVMARNLVLVRVYDTVFGGL